MNAVGITENVKGDVKKFEIWYSGREVVYIVQVFDLSATSLWTQTVSIPPLPSLTHLSCSALCVRPGSHSGGEGRLASGDPEDSHQTAKTQPRFLFVY